MRALAINQRQIYYANRIGEEENAYGETKPIYSDPVPVRVHVQYLGTPIRIAEFGKTSDCTVKLISAEALPFNEHTVFWIDRHIGAPHDYIMRACVNKTVNGAVYGLKEG